MSKLNLDDRKLVVIDEAKLRRLRARCISLTEDLDDLSRVVAESQSDSGKRKAIRPYDYTLEIRATTRLSDNDKWEATCDHETWTKGHPDQHTAIQAAVKAELKSILKSMESE